MAHSSVCSAKRAPTRRVTAARLGKIPTTSSVRRRISLLMRSWGLLLLILGQCSVGKALKAKISSAASSRKVTTSTKPAWVNLSVTSASWLQVVTVGLLEDRAHQGGNHGPVALGPARGQVGHEVGATPL